MNFSKINNLINSKAFDFGCFMLSFILHYFPSRTVVQNAYQSHSIFDSQKRVWQRECSHTRVTKAQIGVWPFPLGLGVFQALVLSFSK